jgi:hypothetical protein
LLFLVLLAGRLTSRLGHTMRFRFALLTLWVGYPLALSCIADSDWYGRRFSRLYPGRQFVASYLKKRAADRQRPLTLYWHTDLRALWFDIHANSYFNLVQMSGCAFNRGTALEGRRRAMLVRPFELESIRRLPFPSVPCRRSILRFYRAEENPPPPGARELLRLCEDKDVDFIVLEIGIDSLYCDTDGRYYIYDCDRLRASSIAHSGPG